MPKGTQHKAFMNKNKSFLKAECGFEITGRPENVSLKHKLHIKNCETCKMFHTKPLDPNIYKGKTTDGKAWFHCNNEDRRNITKFTEKKKEENSTTKISVAEYDPNNSAKDKSMTPPQYEKFRKTKQYEEDMKALKTLLYIKMSNANLGIINSEFIDKQIKSFNQFMIAEALGQIKQEMID